MLHGPFPALAGGLSKLCYEILVFAIEFCCHIDTIFWHVVTDVTHIQQLLILDALSGHLQLEELVVAHGHCSIDGAGDIEVDVRDEWYPLNAEPELLIHRHWQLTEAGLPMAHLLATKALLAIQRCVGDYHQVVLLRHLQDVYQRYAIVYKAHGRHQVQRDELALAFREVIDTRFRGGGMLNHHVKSGFLIIAHITCHVKSHKLRLSRPLRGEYQLLLGIRDADATEQQSDA